MGRRRTFTSPEPLDSMDKITILNPGSVSVGGPPHSASIEVEDLSQVSDGYHTIAELYDHRITLYIALCRAQNYIENEFGCARFVWRSKFHGDGNPAYEGWFIMGIGKEHGKQISYHLPISRWEEADFAETLDKAPEWDGHSSAQVLERLKSL